MIQLILKVFSWFCGLGGQYIAPFITPLLNPLCWSVLILSCFLPIYFSGQNFLNSSENEKGEKVSSGGRAFGFAFLIWYISAVSIVCVIMQYACSINERLNPLDNIPGLNLKSSQGISNILSGAKKFLK